MVEPATSTGRPPARRSTQASTSGRRGGSGLSNLRFPVTVTRPGATPSSSSRSRSASVWTPKRSTGSSRWRRTQRRNRRSRGKLRSLNRPLTTAIGNPAAAGAVEQQRPVVPLAEHQRPWREAVEEALDRSGQLEGQVGDGGAAGEQRSGPFLAGRRDRGHQERQVARQGAGEGRGDAHLTDRNGVDPERAAHRLARRVTEPRRERSAIAAAARHEQPGRGGPERCGDGDAVERSHRRRAV